MGAAVLEELRSSRGNEYLVAILRRLERDNPRLARFVAAFAIQQQDRAATTTGALLLYRLLESQLEADRMREEFH